MEGPGPTAAVGVGLCGVCTALSVPMGLDLLGISYSRCSEICKGLLMVCMCSVGWFICYIADTDLESIEH